MNTKTGISVNAREGQNLNGLGMMMLQYLEQNLSDFKHKVRQGRRIRGVFTVEMEGGVASTITFKGDKIQIENDVSNRPDLHLKGSYMVMTKVIAGQANPFVELLRKNIKPAAFPRRPIQSYKLLRFLRIPEELTGEGKIQKQKKIRIIGWGLGLSALFVLIYILFAK